MVLRGGPQGAPGAHRFEMRRPHPGGEAGAREEREIIVVGGAATACLMSCTVPVTTAPAARPASRSAPWAARAAAMATWTRTATEKLSEAEFTAPLRDAFARMDADRSGFIEDGERGGDGDVRVFTHRIETREEELIVPGVFVI
ncbi:MAG: hypothetical protein KL785_07225 [Brevundimonas sp.]|nr:hypothetical protein [Brevundimonas sp.]